MKIFAATPTHDGRMCIETARALLNEQMLAHGAGVEFKAVFLPSCSLITHGRNQLVRDFMQSDFDRLVFIDSDVSWEPGALVKIAHRPVDLVGGAYRYKDEKEGYSVGFLADRKEIWADPATGLIEVQHLPGGFLAINRCVFEQLKAAHPGRAYLFHGDEYQGYFHAPIDDYKMFGEDVAFCYDWRDLGGKVWLDPEITLEHIGGHNRYKGHIGNWLRSRIPDGYVPEGAA